MSHWSHWPRFLPHQGGSGSKWRLYRTWPTVSICKIFTIKEKAATVRSIRWFKRLAACKLSDEEILSYLSFLFFGTLHSDGYIFPFPLCLLFLVFFQLFARPLQTTILLFCISFSWGWSWSLPPVQCHEPPSIVHQALCLSNLVP